jgi:arginine/lysine/ornithine decarboxylase
MRTAGFPVLAAALAALVLPAAAVQPPQKTTVSRLRAGMAVMQKDSPLQVLGLGSSAEDLAEYVRVMNVSARPIVHVQLGWTADGCGKAPARLVSLGPPQDVLIEPGRWTTLGRQGIHVSQILDSLGRLDESCGEVIVGVVEVRFADGGHWRHDLERLGKFEISDSPVLRRRLAAAAEEMRRDSAGRQ